MGAHHEITVRYGEVDPQRVVFNANYMAYVDDAVDHWLKTGPQDLDWDFMVKRAEIVWQSSARHGDVVAIDSEVARWGTTSFTIRHRLTVDGRPVADVESTYVGVLPDTNTPAPPPQVFRDHLGEAAPSSAAAPI